MITGPAHWQGGLSWAMQRLAVGHNWSLGQGLGTSSLSSTSRRKNLARSYFVETYLRWLQSKCYHFGASWWRTCFAWTPAAKSLQSLERERVSKWIHVLLPRKLNSASSVQEAEFWIILMWIFSSVIVTILHNHAGSPGECQKSMHGTKALPH